MVGMLQIITWLLCTYLIFKGFEILQLALTSAAQNRGAAIRLGVFFFVLSILAAAYFGFMINQQAMAVGNIVQ